MPIRIAQLGGRYVPRIFCDRCDQPIGRVGNFCWHHWDSSATQTSSSISYYHKVCDYREFQPWNEMFSFASLLGRSFDAVDQDADA